MREFFKPWRRKIGVATLLVALMAMGGWVRSLYLQDSFSYHTTRHSVEQLHSGKHHVRWISFFWDDPQFIRTYPLWQTHPVSDHVFLSSFHEQPEFKWKLRWNGFGYGYATDGYYELKYRMIPYWFIVIPPTIVSAVCFLKKPVQDRITQIKIVKPSAGCTGSPGESTEGQAVDGKHWPTIS